MQKINEQTKSIWFWNYLVAAISVYHINCLRIQSREQFPKLLKNTSLQKFAVHLPVRISHTLLEKIINFHIFRSA